MEGETEGKCAMNLRLRTGLDRLRLGSWLPGAKAFARSLIYQDERLCVLCGAAGGPICPECRKTYFHPELGRCHNCGKLIPPAAALCTDCHLGKGPRHLSRVVAWGHYDGAWKDFIWQVKFKGRPRLLERVGQDFALWALDRLPPVDGIIAVPIHPERLAERGFNQAEVLASLLHWQLGLPLVDGLARVRATPPQVKLNRQERLHNLIGAFRAVNPHSLTGRSFWLVDDVTTTGATLEACAEVLQDAGATEVYGLCLAAGMEKMLVGTWN